MSFLDETRVAPEFKALGGAGVDKRLAVAFWGEGALAALGLEGSGAKGARVVCNLESGATKPSVIRDLMDAGADVRTNARLHGKVYLNQGVAIIGSSNASANGLAVQGRELVGWHEANLMTDDKSVIAKAGEWFRRIWDSRETADVDEGVLAEAEERWNTRRSIAPVKRSGETLLAACRAHPELFRNVFLAIYDEGLGERANRMMGAIQKGKAIISGLAQIKMPNAWGYQYDGFRDGEWLIDVDIKPRPPRIWGISQVQTPQLRVPVPGEDTLTITLKYGRRIKLDGLPRPVRLSAADEKFLLDGLPTLLGPPRPRRLGSRGLKKIRLVDALRTLDRVTPSG